MTEHGSDLWTPSRPDPDGPDPDGGGYSAATRTAPVGASRRPGDRGPSEVPPARTRRRWPWTVLVLVLVGVVALLLGLVRCGAESSRTVVPPPPSWSAPPPPPAPGSLSADVTSVFAAAAAGGQGLTSLTGQTATGLAVPVQSVPADEGFWIGTGVTDRVWVQLTSNGESAITITPGLLLDLAGPVVPHGADFAGKAGVSAADGAEQLTRAGAHLEVDPNKITIVGGPTTSP